MNRLLLLTDFSNASGSAQQYAVAMSRDYRLPLTVLQQVVVPVPFVGPDEMLLPVVPIADTREVAQQRLDEKLEMLRASNPDIVVDGQLFYGEVSVLAGEDENYRNATLVIDNDVLNSDGGWPDAETPGMLRNAEISVIAVPGNYSYKPVSRILLALDPATDISEFPMRPLQSWLDRTGAELHIVAVSDDKERIAELSRNFPSNAVFRQVSPTGKLEDSVLPAALQAGADWIAVAPHAHGILGNLFHKSHLQALAKGCPLPMIALHMPG